MTAAQGPKEAASAFESLRRRALGYARLVGASQQLEGNIEDLLVHLAGTSGSPTETLRPASLLQYWHYDGLPLATRIVLYFALLDGLLTIPAEQTSAWSAFKAYMEEFLAREATILRSREAGGWLFPGEPEFLWELAKGASEVPGQLCELGSWTGRSALIWCGALKFTNSEKRLYVVDNWNWGKEGDRYPFMTEGREIHAEFVGNLAGFEAQYVIKTGLIEDVLGDLCRDIGTDGLAVLFHDASHSYPEVYRDLETYLPLLRKGGILLVHDYGHPGFPEVKRATDTAVSKRLDLVLEKVVNTLAVFRRNSTALCANMTETSFPV